MIVPIVLAAVLATVGYALGRPKKKPSIVSGFLSYHPQPSRKAKPPSGQSAVALLTRTVAQGRQASPGLINAAYTEAQQTGDTRTMRAIVDYAAELQAQQMAMYQAQQGILAEPAAQVVAGQDLDGADGADGDGDGDGEGGPESWGESIAATVTTQHLGQPPQVQQVEAAQAPVIPYPAGWDKFAQALKTRDPAYKSDNYLGAFEHNRRRLRQLGITEEQLGSEQDQYKAFCRDMDNYRDGHTKLIAEWTGKAVDVNGQVCSVTPSGILGLLKAAGPRGAEGWLRNASDRTAFPTTTEVFMRTNGCF